MIYKNKMQKQEKDEFVLVMNKQYRNLCFTLRDMDYWETIVGGWDYGYVIISHELGQETWDSKQPYAKQKWHIQGYVEFGRQVRGSALKKLHSQIHWESREGTAFQAMMYCRKELPVNYLLMLQFAHMDAEQIDKYLCYEHGKISRQGERIDLEDLSQMIIHRVPMIDVAAANPKTYVKFHKGFDALCNLQYKNRIMKPRVIWIYGAAGVGKTRHCVDNHPDSHYIKDGTQWWPNYAQEDAIIIDDFDGKWPFRDLLRLLDRYKYAGQYKGGYVKVNSPNIYITCEFHPSKYWSDNDLDQVMRRVDYVIHKLQHRIVIEKRPNDMRGSDNKFLEFMCQKETESDLLCQKDDDTKICTVRDQGL